MKSSIVWFPCLVGASAMMVVGCGEVSTPAGAADQSTGDSVFPCSEQGLLDAIAQGGGPHYFDCEGETTVMTTEEIVISEDVVLDGRGVLTLDAHGAHRVVSVRAEVEAELRGFTITGGKVCENDDPHGGGILNDGTLVVRDSVIANNEAPLGGGLASSGVLAVIDSTVADNTADFGGGISASHWLIVRDSVVARNEAAVGYGGGVFNEFGLTVLMNAEVSENAAHFGGGIFNWGRMAVLTSEVTDNRAEARDLDFGGGIFNEFGEITLSGTTVSGNEGGGICNCRTTYNGGLGTLTVVESSISENEARGILNVGTATMNSTGVFDNARGAIFNEGTLELTGCEITGLVHASSRNSHVQFASTSVEGTCTESEAATWVSEGHNFETPGDTCSLDHTTDRVNGQNP